MEPVLTTIQIPGLGVLEGWQNSDGTKQFFGIPYAQYSERFRNSKEITSWPDNKFDARKLGHYAPQPQRPFYPFPMPERPHLGESHQGEFDCLNLHITLPSGTKPEDKLPVMIWFHGGGFVFGTANYSVLDGRGVANISSDIGCPTIFVTVNYRLGFFGFLASDDIKEDNARYGGGNGNQAIRDQHNAIKWVVKNIGALGGNPDDVTLFGQSAGAISVDMHIRAPHRQLIKRAILMSGVVPICGHYTEAEYHNIYLKLVRACGIDLNLPGSERLAALRAVPYEKLCALTIEVMNNLNLPQFGPCVDGEVLGDVTIPTLADYVFNKLDWDGQLMITDVQYEGIIYDHEFTMTAEELVSWARQILPEEIASDMLTFYKISSSMTRKELYHACEAIVTDAVFCGPAYFMAKNHPDAFVAHWDYRSPFDNAWGGYAHHSLDYFFSWQGLNGILKPHEIALGRATAEDYIRFANGQEPYPRGVKDGTSSKRACRVYTAEAKAEVFCWDEYKGRRIEWFERMGKYMDKFDKLAFEITMRRSKLVSLEEGVAAKATSNVTFL
ncbi:hypothetical protein D9758_002121 [Tetrapyrgos nigripes]|uniref:Carboxylesterase type B domain-containing protein n=1 Tax=Tetrapyrgos nigripes TaxID=182062 RepID=A0A8H5LVE8_9AGAR|nr:hypothetical protein D9758_002121 [Tetrapyrgos nigripes]